MTTIEQGARKFLGLDSTDPNYRHTDDDIKELSIFKAGVEFAQRWIPIQEELPTVNEEKYQILVKFTIGQDLGTKYIFDSQDIEYINRHCTHWRPITIE